MGTTILDGPLYAYGAMGKLLAAVTGGNAVPDPNPEAGPSMLYQGMAIPDARYFFQKDKIGVFTGLVPMLLDGSALCSVNQIPAAASTTRIAAAAATVNGTAMTLATAQAVGVAPGIPIIAFDDGILNAGSAVTVVGLDFGFAFGNITSGDKTVVVADSTQFQVGMPLVIGGVGNAAGTSALLTYVTEVTDATHIEVNDAPAATNATAPIGTGNLWGPGENGFPTPTAAFPYLAKGGGLFLDPRQALARGVSITATNGGAAGGVFRVVGYDVYGMSMSEDITHAGGATTAFGDKAFKYIASVTPQFTDAQTYSVGTSDVFAFNTRVNQIEQTTTWYAGQLSTSGQGFVAADSTSPATRTTGDVRGTLQVSANGPTGGIAGPVSNGAIVALAMSGLRLYMGATLLAHQQLNATPDDPVPLFGVTQV